MAGAPGHHWLSFGITLRSTGVKDRAELLKQPSGGQDWGRPESTGEKPRLHTHARHCPAGPVPSPQSPLGPPSPSQHSPSTLLLESKPLLAISQRSTKDL